MLKTIFLLVSVMILTTLPVQYGYSEVVAPSERAFQISSKQPHVKDLHSKLVKQAQAISNPTFKTDALAILEKPAFTVFEANRSLESEILKKLSQEGLVPPSSSSIFPQTSPMSFLAAPGSSHAGHHSYPGGLVYHTYTNLRLGLQYAEIYQEVYHVKLNVDYIRFAAILHDSAKTVTIQWKSNGEVSPEAEIAGTSAHHIFAVSEALHRKYPTSFVVTLASAHSPPFAGEPLKALVKFLKAAAIIANVPYSAAGLNERGEGLKALPPIEAFVNHLDDHDYLLTQSSIETVDQSFDKAKTDKDSSNSSEIDYWERNRKLSEKGDLIYYQKVLRDAKE